MLRRMVVAGLVLGVAACSSKEAAPSDGGAGSGGGAGTGSGSGGGQSEGGGSSGDAGAGTSSGGATSGGGSGDAGSGTPSGGASSGSGSGGGAGSSSGGTGGSTPEDPFEITAHLASDDDPRAPTTVAIVDWSTTLGTPAAATIEFGLTTDYGMEASVDVSAPELRGVLIGMKPNQTYHFRISASVGGETVLSGDRTIRTGAPPSPSPVTSHMELVAGEREPGFIVASSWAEGSGGTAFILDPDGDVVWWYDPGLADGVARAAISADGRDVWMISPNNLEGEPLVRVGLDGLAPQEYPSTSGSHDIIPIEGDLMAFIEYGGSSTGVGVSEVNRAGELAKVLRYADLPPAMNQLGSHHLNALAYDAASDTYLVSARDTDIFRFPRAGATSENIVGLSSILGPNAGWGGSQHTVQLLADNHLLMFANRAVPDPRASSVIEFDLADGSEVWRYDAPEFTDHFGCVQRLPGGNTLVTVSNAGVIHETTPDKKKVLEVRSPLKLGYATWLPSLGSHAPSQTASRPGYD